MFKLNMFSSARKRPPRFLMSYQKRGDVGKSSLTSSEQDVKSDNTISKNKDNVKVELPTKMNVHNKKIMPMTLQFNRRPTYTGPNKKVTDFISRQKRVPDLFNIAKKIPRSFMMKNTRNTLDIMPIDTINNKAKSIIRYVMPSKNMMSYIPNHKQIIPKEAFSEKNNDDIQEHTHSHSHSQVPSEIPTRTTTDEQLDNRTHIQDDVVSNDPKKALPSWLRK